MIWITNFINLWLFQSQHSIITIYTCTISYICFVNQRWNLFFSCGQVEEYLHKNRINRILKDLSHLSLNRNIYIHRYIYLWEIFKPQRKYFFLFLQRRRIEEQAQKKRILQSNILQHNPDSRPTSGRRHRSEKQPLVGSKPSTPTNLHGNASTSHLGHCNP